MRMPELLDDHPTDGLVAALTVEQHDGPEPLCERGLEDIADIGEHRFVADRERAAETHMVQIGRAHVWTPVTTAHLLCRLLLGQPHSKHTRIHIDAILACVN